VREDDRQDRLLPDLDMWEIRMNLPHSTCALPGRSRGQRRSEESNQMIAGCATATSGRSEMPNEEERR
jgi:hypothetical protein